MITVTPPLTAPQNVIATLQSGGSLQPNTTYYVRVTAKNTTSYQWSGALCSPPSVEISFATDAVNLRAKIDWDAVTDAACYNVYVSTVSGDYDNKRCNSGGTIPTATTNAYTVTAEPAGSSYPWDSFAMRPDYQLWGGIDRETGTLLVNFDGPIILEDIYDAIVTAGYSDYVRYSTPQGEFILHGSLYVTGSNTGSLTALNTVLVFLQGVLRNQNGNVAITLGEYDAGNDITKNGCIICFGGWTETFFFDNITVYDTVIKPSLLGYGYAIANGVMQAYLTNNTFRDVTMIDAQIGGGNYPPSNMRQKGYANKSAYWNGEANNLRTERISLFLWFHFVPAFRGSLIEKKGWTYHFENSYSGDLSASQYDIHIYDTIFDTADNLPVINWGTTLAQRHIKIYYSIDFKIVDENNNPLSETTIIIKDKDDTQVFSGVTDANGEATAPDILRADMTHDLSAGAGYGAAYTIIDERNPFIATFVKQGYQQRTRPLTLNKKTELVEKLDLVPSPLPVVTESFEFDSQEDAVECGITEDSITADITNIVDYGGM